MFYIKVVDTDPGIIQIPTAAKFGSEKYNGESDLGVIRGSDLYPVL